MFGIGWVMGCVGGAVLPPGANGPLNANSCLMALPLAFAFAFDLAFFYGLNHYL